MQIQGDGHIIGGGRMAGLNQPFSLGREPLKGPQGYAGRAKHKTVLAAANPADRERQPSLESHMPFVGIPYLAEEPEKKPPAKLPDLKLPEDWKRVLPNENQRKQFEWVFKGLLPQMLDPGGVRITQQGSGETIRQAQWARQRSQIQSEIKNLEAIERRFSQNGALTPAEKEQVIIKPQEAREKEWQSLDRLILLVTRQKESLERGQLKVGILLADNPDQRTLQNRLQAMQVAHEQRIKKANDAQTALNQQMLKAVDKNPDALLMRVSVVQAELTMAYQEASIFNVLVPELQGLIKDATTHEALTHKAKALTQRLEKGLQDWVEKEKALKLKRDENNRLTDLTNKLMERLDHPEYFPYEHWTAEQKTEALTVVQAYTQQEIQRRKAQAAGIETSQAQLNAGGLNALRLPQDHSDLEKQWGKHVMVSVSTGQEQSAIFKEHFKSFLERAKTTDSLAQAMIETTQKDAKAFALKYPFGLGAESVYSTPMVSTNQLELWKKKDDTVKKRVVVYIQGHHHVDVQKQWMDADETKMKAQLSEDYQTGETPLEWVSLKGKNKQEVLETLTQLKSQATSDTEFLVVMNGHGMQVPSDNDKLDPRLEGSPEGRFQLTQTEDLTENDMKEALQHLSGSRGVLLLLSSCHSGAWIARSSLPKIQNGDSRYYS